MIEALNLLAPDLLAAGTIQLVWVVLFIIWEDPRVGASPDEGGRGPC